MEAVRIFPNVTDLRAFAFVPNSIVRHGGRNFRLDASQNGQHRQFSFKFMFWDLFYGKSLFNIHYNIQTIFYFRWALSVTLHSINKRSVATFWFYWTIAD